MRLALDSVIDLCQYFSNQLKLYWFSILLKNCCRKLLQIWTNIGNPPVYVFLFVCWPSVRCLPSVWDVSVCSYHVKLYWKNINLFNMMVLLFICELKAELFSEPIRIKWCLLKWRLNCVWLIARYATRRTQLFVTWTRRPS